MIVVRMSILNRNIVLFFEENQDPMNISSRLVRLYMNRLVIDEEQQMEVIGSFNLTKVCNWDRPTLG